METTISDENYSSTSMHSPPRSQGKNQETILNNSSPSFTCSFSPSNPTTNSPSQPLKSTQHIYQTNIPTIHKPCPTSFHPMETRSKAGTFKPKVYISQTSELSAELEPKLLTMPSKQ